MNIESDILHWDGKSADDIRAIHNQYRGDKNYIIQLTEIISNKELRTGATWLLKVAFESGAVMSKEDAHRIIDNLGELDFWQQKLHILQIFEFIPIGVEQKSSVERFLRVCLSDDNKLVRAWAYSGFYYLARQHQEFRKEAMQFFEMALRDEAASVKARVNKLRQIGF